jgi:hypothetical protein
LKNTYTIKEAQRNLVSVVHTAERGEVGIITRQKKPVAYVLSPACLSELLETFEILTDSKAMKAIRAAERGSGKIILAKALPA